MDGTASKAKSIKCPVGAMSNSVPSADFIPTSTLTKPGEFLLVSHVNTTGMIGLACKMSNV